MIKLYPDDVIPTQIVSEDTSYEVGSCFSTSREGWLIGVRFYRATLQCTGPFIARLWAETLLSSTVPLETDELGWQTCYFNLPVKLRPGLNNYVVSVGVPTAHHVYGETTAGQDVQEGPLAYINSCYGVGAGNYPDVPGPYAYFIDPLFSVEPPSVIFNMSVSAAPPTGGESVAADAAITSHGVAMLPWTPPAGWDYLITDVVFSTKHVQWVGMENFWGWRNSYMHVVRMDSIEILMTVTSAESVQGLGTPLPLLDGTPLGIGFQNASQEVQNMAGFINGRLVPSGTWRWPA